MIHFLNHDDCGLENWRLYHLLFCTMVMSLVDFLLDWRLGRFNDSNIYLSHWSNRNDHLSKT